MKDPCIRILAILAIYPLTLLLFEGLEHVRGPWGWDWFVEYGVAYITLLLAIHMHTARE